MVLDASPSIDNSDSGSLNSVKTDPYPSNLIETSSFVEVATFGVEIKIIDYTLSRMKPSSSLVFLLD